MPKYFYTHFGRQYGPVDAEQLKQLAAQGHIVPEDYVRCEGGNRRFLARDVKGLFASPPPPPIASEGRLPAAEAIGAAPCIFCPSCHNLIVNDGSLAGRTVSCPHCSTMMQMPGRATPIVPPPITNHSSHTVSGGGPKHRIASQKPNPLVAALVPVGLIVAVVGVFCPWYSSVSSSSTIFGGSASFAASFSGWWTIPGILTGLLSLPGMAFGVAMVFSRNRALPVLASTCGLLVALLGVWGMYYAPSVTSSVDCGGYGSGQGRVGFDWGVFVTMAGGAIAAVAGIASLLFRGLSRRTNIASTTPAFAAGRQPRQDESPFSFDATMNDWRGSMSGLNSRPIRKVSSTRAVPLLINLAASVLGVVLLVVILCVAPGRPTTNASTSGSNGQVSEASIAIKTKSEFKRTFYSSIHEALPGVVSEKAVIKTYGNPVRTQTIGDDAYWYWQCTDGMIQMVIVAGNPQALAVSIGEGNILVKALNDY